MSTQPIGLDDALSRIEQIQTYQQQLLNPSAALAQSAGTGTSGATSAATATTGAGATSSTSGSDFASLLSALQTGSSSATTESPLVSSLTGGTSGTGTDSLLLSLLSDLSNRSGTSASTGSSADGIGETSGIDATSGGAGLTGTSDADLPSAVQNMISEADSLIGKPYVWGGGHDGWGAQSGYDCSGFVSAVLHAGGYLASPQDTVGLASSPGITSGPGQYVTIYDRTDAGVGNDHVIIDIDGQFYESGGEQGPWGGGAGVMKIAAPSADYLKTFNRILHPDGL